MPRPEIDSVTIANAIWSAVAMVLTDRAGAIRAASPAAATLFGYAQAALEGMAVEVLVPDTLAAQHATLRADYAVRPTYRGMAGRALPGRRRDGTPLPLFIALAPLTLAGVDYVLAIMTLDTDPPKEA